MIRAVILKKLLALGPLTPLNAMAICGWPVDEFDSAVDSAISLGLVRRKRGCNQHETILVAA